MDDGLKKPVLLGLFLLIYGLILYFFVLGELNMDYVSFYSSAIAFTKNINPYRSLEVSYYALATIVSPNLNTPFFLLITSPMAALSFPEATAFWFLISLIFGITGALISFKLSSPAHFFKKNWFYCLCIYLGMYSTLMNTTMGQIGGILLFLIIMGYYCYLRNQYTLASLFWGIIITIKIFPALLFFFVLSQKRYRLFFMMLTVFLVASLLPALFKGNIIYLQYFHLLQKVYWFGVSWNSSVYGFLFRLFINPGTLNYVWLIKIAFLFFFTILLGLYIHKLNYFNKTEVNTHRAFCLTIVFMLLMSPMGWLYYFSLLIMPMNLIYQSLNAKTPTKVPVLWLLSFFLINAPIGNMGVSFLNNIFYKLSIGSFHFYGLVLIAYLIQAPTVKKKESSISHSYYFPITVSLLLGLLITTSNIGLHMIIPHQFEQVD